MSDDDDNWRVRAACRDAEPELWYPDNPRDAWLGVWVCNGCPVRQECLAYAQARREPYGTWGGVTEWERITLRLPT
jgi:WhiB family redox-sensing transcriptional regulator